MTVTSNPSGPHQDSIPDLVVQSAQAKSIEPRFPVAAISRHPCLKLVESFLAQGVEALLPVGAHLHDPRLRQDAQVPGNTGLMDVHAFDNVAYGAFARLHRLDDAKAGWISECMKQKNLRIHAYTFSRISHIVKYRSRALPESARQRLPASSSLRLCA